jgi:3-hydroxybutyryl-CoA dehydrogenase
MFRHIGVVGAGTMGRGIAQLAALSKFNVHLYDVNETILRRSIEYIKADLRKMINLGKLSTDEFAETIERIRTRTSLSDLGHCDCIIESIIEDIRVKADLFKHLDTLTNSTAVLASTTSSLPITSIASLTRYPERVIGLHFFNPIYSTPLVEVVKGYKTNTETLDHSIEWIKLFCKEYVIVKDLPGFVVNRVSFPFFSEALRLLGENVAYAEQIDNIIKKIGGFSAGPFETLDRMGIDTALAEIESLYNQSFGEPRLRPHPILKQMVESGLLGKKSIKGFYNYEEIK